MEFIRKPTSKYTLKPFSNDKEDCSSLNKYIIVRVPDEYRVPGETKYQLASLNFRDPASSCNFPADKMLRELAGIKVPEDEEDEKNNLRSNSISNIREKHSDRFLISDDSVACERNRPACEFEFQNSPQTLLPSPRTRPVWNTSAEVPVWESPAAQQQYMSSMWSIPPTRRPMEQWRPRQRGRHPPNNRYNCNVWNQASAMHSSSAPNSSYVHDKSWDSNLNYHPSASFVGEEFRPDFNSARNSARIRSNVWENVYKASINHRASSIGAKARTNATGIEELFDVSTRLEPHAHQFPRDLREKIRHSRKNVPFGKFSSMSQTTHQEDRGIHPNRRIDVSAHLKPPAHQSPRDLREKIQHSRKNVPFDEMEDIGQGVQQEDMGPNQRFAFHDRQRGHRRRRRN